MAAGIQSATDAINCLKGKACAGSNVAEKLSDILAEVLELKPKNPAAVFESVLLSESILTQPAPVDPVKVGKKGVHAPVQKLSDVAAASSALELLGQPPPVINEDGEPEPAPEADEYAFHEPATPEDLMACLTACGEGLPGAEQCGVLAAMKRLGGDADKKVDSLRFWGKVHATRGAYYVFECAMSERPEPAEGEEQEPPASEAAPEAQAGCNKFMYHVCSRLGGPFTLLDDVTPAQIRAARALSTFLTGDLDAAVAGSPPFPGRERHLLRAQIARIAHATTLCPEGFFATPEEGETELTANEEYVPPPGEVMRDPAKWCHRAAHVKAMGVTVLPELPEAEEDAPPPLPEQVEAGPDALAAASADAAVQGMPAWVPITSRSSCPVNNSVAGVKSVAWPGALAVTDGTVWANVYVGWGVKRGARAGVPQPPAMQAVEHTAKEDDSLPPPPPPPEAEEEE